LSPWIRKRRKRKSKIVPVLLWIAIVIAIGIIQWHGDAPTSPEPTVEYKSPDLAPSPALEKSPPSWSHRTIYPYSIIPGGALDRVELVAAVARDRVAAGHYTSFQVSQTRVMHLQKDMSAHVSYRLRDKVYWTAKTLVLKRGEALLTDGRELARTRCGNRVSMDAMEPTSPEEPPLETFDAPVVTFEEPTRMDMVEIPTIPTIPPSRPLTPPPYQWASPPPPEYPMAYRIRPPRKPPTTVPEPGTLALLGSGLAAGLMIWLAVRRK
jgi:hypothetical protein